MEDEYCEPAVQFDSCERLEEKAPIITVRSAENKNPNLKGKAMKGKKSVAGMRQRGVTGTRSNSFKAMKPK